MVWNEIKNLFTVRGHYTDNKKDQNKKYPKHSPSQENPQSSPCHYIYQSHLNQQGLLAKSDGLPSHTLIPYTSFFAPNPSFARTLHHYHHHHYNLQSTSQIHSPSSAPTENTLFSNSTTTPTPESCRSPSHQYLPVSATSPLSIMGSPILHVQGEKNGEQFSSRPHYSVQSPHNIQKEGDTYLSKQEWNPVHNVEYFNHQTLSQSEKGEDQKKYAPSLIFDVHNGTNKIEKHLQHYSHNDYDKGNSISDFESYTTTAEEIPKLERNLKGSVTSRCADSRRYGIRCNPDVLKLFVSRDSIPFADDDGEKKSELKEEQINGEASQMKNKEHEEKETGKDEQKSSSQTTLNETKEGNFTEFIDETNCIGNDDDNKIGDGDDDDDLNNDNNEKDIEEIDLVTENKGLENDANDSHLENNESSERSSSGSKSIVIPKLKFIPTNYPNQTQQDDNSNYSQKSPDSFSTCSEFPSSSSLSPLSCYHYICTNSLSKSKMSVSQMSLLPNVSPSPSARSTSTVTSVAGNEISNTNGENLYDAASTTTTIGKFLSEDGSMVNNLENVMADIEKPELSPRHNLSEINEEEEEEESRSCSNGDEKIFYEQFHTWKYIEPASSPLPISLSSSQLTKESELEVPPINLSKRKDKRKKLCRPVSAQFPFTNLLSPSSQNSSNSPNHLGFIPSTIISILPTKQQSKHHPSSNLDSQLISQRLKERDSSYSKKSKRKSIFGFIYNDKSSDSKAIKCEEKNCKRNGMKEIHNQDAKADEQAELKTPPSSGRYYHTRTAPLKSLDLNNLRKGTWINGEYEKADDSIGENEKEDCGNDDFLYMNDLTLSDLGSEDAGKDFDEMNDDNSFCTLQIMLIEARNLVDADVGFKECSNPYAVLELISSSKKYRKRRRIKRISNIEKKLKCYAKYYHQHNKRDLMQQSNDHNTMKEGNQQISSVIFHDLNPKWNESFKFLIPYRKSKQNDSGEINATNDKESFSIRHSLEIRIYDYDRIFEPHKLMGKVIISHNELNELRMRQIQQRDGKGKLVNTWKPVDEETNDKHWTSPNSGEIHIIYQIIQE